MKTRRTLKTIGLAAASVVALAGCIKMDMHLDLQSDDSVDGTMTVAVSKPLAELSGQDADALVDQMRSDFLGSSDDFDSVSADPYEDDDFIGSTMRFEGAALDQFSGGATGDSISIVRDSDEFVISGVMDLADEAEDLDMSMLGGAMDIKIAVTFPGAVASHNGELDGRTVTWIPKIGERLEIDARGSAVGGGGGGLPLLAIVGIGLAVLAVVLVVVILLLRNRSRSADAVPYGADVTGTPGVAPGAVPGAPVPPVGATVGEPTVAVPPVTAAPTEPPAATTPPAPAPPSTIPPAQTPTPPASPEGTPNPDQPAPGTPPPPPAG